MSRICVKGLPPYVSEDRLRALFGAAGSITDVKVARTKDGKSRRFAFVGFAEAGLESVLARRFSNTFVDTARIHVEEAKPIGDDSVLQRSWSRYSKKKLPVAAAAPQTTSATAKARPHTDARVDEYVAVVTKSAKRHTWANDDGTGMPEMNPAAQARAERAAARSKHGKASSSGVTEDDEEEGEAQTPEDDAAVSDAAAAGKAATMPPAASTLDDLAYLRSRMSTWRDDEEEEEGEDGEGREDGEDGKGKEPSGTAGKRRRPATADEDAAADGLPMRVDGGASTKRPRGAFAASGEEAQANVKSVEQRERATEGDTNRPDAARPDAVDLGETGRLFVRNLPFTATEDQLRVHFSRFGRIAEVTVAVDAAGKQKGYGYVTYMIPEHAVLALAETDGKTFMGRLLHVLPARAPPSEDTSGASNVGDSGMSSFKRSRETTRKAEAGSEKEQRSVWSALFVRADTSVAALAERLGVARSDVLDRDADSMAVRVALAETQLIAETKAFLRDNDIDLDELEKGLAAAPPGEATVKRSTTTMLVKNLPFSVTQEALRELFARHGALSRVLLPPSRAIAIVEYEDARRAKKAFSQLAYSRFERVPLYLEWAPAKVFVTPPPPPSAAVPAQKPEGGVDKAPTTAAAVARDDSAADLAGSDAAVEGSPVDQRTVYVKNVSFDTTEEGLRNMFATVGVVRSVKIPKKRNLKYNAAAKSGTASQQWLSMGYGFVEFVRADDARKALKQLQGKELDSHALTLRLSATKEDGAAPEKPAQASEKPQAAAGAAEDPTATKLLVRNLAFEANKKDISELFGAFGAVKTIRIPKKFDRTHRGFAFVEFLTHAEAAAAKAALASTHLYGRHLVIEWASAKDEQ